MGRASLRERTRRGFTLLEVMVALMVGASVVLGARAVLGSVSDHATLLSVERRSAASTANGIRVLRQLLLQAEAGSDPGARFAGSSSTMVFDTWCLSSRGWSERCRATLRLESSSEQPYEAVVIGVLSTGETLDLLRISTPARLAYLDDPAHGGRWSESWGPSVVAPRAVGVLIAGDTLVFRAGATQ